jgi:hypothetical protein
VFRILFLEALIMAILLNVGISSPSDMKAAGNAKARRDLNDAVLDAMRYLEEHRKPSDKPYTLELSDNHSFADLEDLARHFRFKGWRVTTPDPTVLALEVAWPQS